MIIGRVHLTIGAVLAGLLLMAGGASGAGQVPQNMPQVTLSFAPLVKETAPAVVNVYARTKVKSRRFSPFADDPFFRHFFGDDGPGVPRERFRNSLGSGVIVDGAGLVVTNNHVVAGASDIRVVLADRREFDARILLSDERTDLAVLKIGGGASGLPALEFGDSDALEVGDLVLAIGNPFGVGQTVTSGIVSALARTEVGVSDYQFFIQTDAAINPGNSGGALIDVRGRLIGINTAIYSRTGGSIGIGFAIPANMVNVVVQSARAGSRVVRPWLGAELQDITTDIADALGLKRLGGSLVAAVAPQSPLAGAGLRRGDVILAVDDREVNSAKELVYRIATKSVGSTVMVNYLRAGTARAATVRLIAAPETPPRSETRLDGDNPLGGLVVVNLSPAVTEELGLEAGLSGVVVERLEDGPARRMGFRPGDIIAELNGEEIRFGRQTVAAARRPRGVVAHRSEPQGPGHPPGTRILRPEKPASMSNLFEAAGLGNEAPRPLADRLRPASLTDVVGQDHLVGREGALTRMLQAGRLGSVVLWGPPGTGKTTIARLLAGATGLAFEQMSAVFSGVADLKKVFEQARIRREQGRGTLLFVDEIHRFNKAQLDSFLPYVENGTITLIGATTENPSFELNAALLSRMQVLTLNRLDAAAMGEIIARAERFEGRALPLTGAAREQLLALADGDGRYLLNLVEEIFSDPGARGGPIGPEELARIAQRRVPLYDKSADGHYNLISALHKSVRGSDADAALYYLARMLVAGENPLYIVRRLVRMALEDIGLADPDAVHQALAAKDAFDFLGSPEGELALAQATLYLATAPKSNAVYAAMGRASGRAREGGSVMPPKIILNAPTRLMKQQEYGAGYRYDHDEPDAFSGQNYFPEGMPPERFYDPTDRGFEREIRKRLESWAQMRRERG